MWHSVMSSNMIIWILAETFEVQLGSPLSWTEPCLVTEMAYYWHLGIATAPSWDKLQCNLSVVPAHSEPFAFRQYGTNITITYPTGRLEGCSLCSPAQLNLSSTAKPLCDPCLHCPILLPAPFLSLGSWKSLSFLTITYQSLRTTKILPKKGTGS